VTKSIFDYTAIMRNRSEAKRPGGHTTQSPGAADYPVNDRAAREFTGDSCLTLEMPGNPSPAHTRSTHRATTAFARFSSIVFACFPKLCQLHRLQSIRYETRHGRRVSYVAGASICPETFRKPAKNHSD
jgi:hypothetical protein